jgi:hypothetical protein
MPHQFSARGNAKEMSAALPLGRLFVNATQAGFVNLASVLKRATGAYLPKIAASEAAQLGAKQRNQLSPSVLVAVPPMEMQLNHPFGRRWAHR